MAHRLIAGSGDRVCARVRLWDSILIPVVAQDAGVLALQQMFDDLNRMPTHCLDLNDLRDLFQNKTGEWATLSILRCTREDQEACSALIELAKAAKVGWFLFRSFASGQHIARALQALDVLLLYTPVVAEGRVDDEILFVTKIE